MITLFLIEREILPTPLLYLSAFFEAARREYYDVLRGVSDRGAWLDWLEYFLLGVARMSEDALSREARMNNISSGWQRRVAGDSTNAPLRLVDLLAANPFVTTTGDAVELRSQGIGDSFAKTSPSNQLVEAFPFQGDGRQKVHRS